MTQVQSYPSLVGTVYLTRDYTEPGYVCHTLTNVRTAALCGDRVLIIGSTLRMLDVVTELTKTMPDYDVVIRSRGTPARPDRRAK